MPRIFADKTVNMNTKNCAYGKGQMFLLPMFYPNYSINLIL